MQDWRYQVSDKFWEKQKYWYTVQYVHFTSWWVLVLYHGSVHVVIRKSFWHCASSWIVIDLEPIPRPSSCWILFHNITTNVHLVYNTIMYVHAIWCQFLVRNWMKMLTNRKLLRKFWDWIKLVYKICELFLTHVDLSFHSLCTK